MNDQSEQKLEEQRKDIIKMWTLTPTEERNFFIILLVLLAAFTGWREGTRVNLQRERDTFQRQLQAYENTTQHR